MPAAYFGNLHNDRYIFRVGKTRSAIGLGDHYAHHAQPPKLLEQLMGKFLLFIPFHEMRPDRLVSEISGRAAYLLGEFFC